MTKVSSANEGHEDISWVWQAHGEHAGEQAEADDREKIQLAHAQRVAHLTPLQAAAQLISEEIPAQDASQSSLRPLRE